MVECAISNGTNGATRDYLVSAAKLDWSVNEKTMRQDCFDLRKRLPSGVTAELVFNTLRGINGFYNTRHSLEHVREFAGILLKAVKDAGWWSADPVMMLDCSDSDAESLAEFVCNTISNIHASGLPKPYSLLTKWLHFCFPDSFAIYDARISLSVQAWSYFTHKLTDPSSGKFLAAETWNTDGSGYKGIIEFYRCCWQYSNEGQQSRLRACAADLTELIGAPVGVIDVLDKLLWLANGDPRKMGLM